MEWVGFLLGVPRGLSIFNYLLFKTANGNPLKHKKPHKKTQQNRNRRTHSKRGTHTSHKEGKQKTHKENKHTHTHTQKHGHPHTQAKSPKGHPHPHNHTQTTKHTPHTTTIPLPSHAENARLTTEGRQGVAKSPKSQDAVRRKRARALTRHERGHASRALWSRVGEIGGTLRPRRRLDGLWAAA